MMKDDDFKLLRGFDYGQTDEQTFVIVESLSRLKKCDPFLIVNPYFLYRIFFSFSSRLKKYDIVKNHFLKLTLFEAF